MASSIPSKRSADAQEAAWVADEDRFVLQQTKKKAAIRIKGGRAQPIDWLTIALVAIDPIHNTLDDEVGLEDLEIQDPETVFEKLNAQQFVDLQSSIDNFLVLEKSKSNRDYWMMMKQICQDRQTDLDNALGSDRSFKPVAEGVHKVMEAKSLEDLERLEEQINAKLSSNDPIDTDYWEQTLKTLLTYKARAKLRQASQAIFDAQRESSRVLRSNKGPGTSASLRKASPPDRESGPKAKRARIDANDSTQASSSQYDREVARGLGENEEIFADEEQVNTKNLAKWSGQHRPRKPKYFNRVQLGYEWNKYNQTHYDHENPPPKVVQGYKFNIFYPDLVDKTATPTYKIERENGRRRGETLAPAGEDDMCVIRFVAGAPYEDVAFRIVDKEWDHSAKRDRGFRSTFDKGNLQLHFQFKKVYYRK